MSGICCLPESRSHGLESQLDPRGVRRSAASEQCSACRVDGWQSVFALAEQLVHVFHKADDDDKNRPNPAYQEHGNEHTIDDLQRQVHELSVLRSSWIAYRPIDGGAWNWG